MPAVFVVQNVHKYYLGGLEVPLEQQVPIENRWTSYTRTTSLRPTYSATETYNVTVRNTVSWIYDRNNHSFKFLNWKDERIHPPGAPRSDPPSDIDLPNHVTLLEPPRETVTEENRKPPEKPKPTPRRSMWITPLRPPLPRPEQRARTPRRSESRPRKHSPKRSTTTTPTPQRRDSPKDNKRKRNKPHSSSESKSSTTNHNNKSTSSTGISNRVDLDASDSSEDKRRRGPP